MRWCADCIWLLLLIVACDEPETVILPAQPEPSPGDAAPTVRNLEPGQLPAQPAIDRYGPMFAPQAEQAPTPTPTLEKGSYVSFVPRAKQPKALFNSGWEVGKAGEVEAYRDEVTHLAWSVRQSGQGGYAEKLTKVVRDHKLLKQMAEDPRTMDFPEAQRVCQQLGASGWWRLPTKAEFEAAMERGLHHMHPAKGGLWTRTEVTGDILHRGEVWTVNLMAMRLWQRYVYSQQDPRLPAGTVCILPPLEAPPTPGSSPP